MTRAHLPTGNFKKGLVQKNSILQRLRTDLGRLIRVKFYSYQTVVVNRFTNQTFALTATVVQSKRRTFIYLGGGGGGGGFLIETRDKHPPNTNTN